MNTNYKISSNFDQQLETREWMESLDYVLQTQGEERTRNLLKELQIHEIGRAHV